MNPPWTIGRVAALIVAILAIVMLFLCILVPSVKGHVELWTLGLLAALAVAVVFD